MRRGFTAVAFAAVVLAALSGRADTGYPLTSLGDWADGTTRDVHDGRTGRHVVEAGIVGETRRSIRYGRALDIAEPIREIQRASDRILRPPPSGPVAGMMAHPAFLPDWDHDGAFGDTGGTSVDGIGDVDADTDDILDAAYFRYPCWDEEGDWSVHARFASRTCDVGDTAGQPYATGVAREVEIVSSRGLVLSATLWFPGEAVDPAACPSPEDDGYAAPAGWLACGAAESLAGSWPAVAIPGGHGSTQMQYYWLASRLASEGFVALTFDPAGQGDSEGTGMEPFAPTDPHAPDCEFPGACRDLMDVARWFVGDPVPPVDDESLRLVPRADPLANEPNPAAGVVDRDRLGFIGHSMGAAMILDYLRFQASGAGADGAPLPAVAAAVSLSGTAETRAIVPIQFQTADHDGMPLGPGVMGVNYSDGDGIGYHTVKQRYDQLRGTDDLAALSLVVLESGTHTDHGAAAMLPRTPWALSLSGHYASAWLRCFLSGSTDGCAQSRTARPHLSRAFASEIDPDGPAGPSESICIAVPTEASVGHDPERFTKAMVGEPTFDCATG